MTTTSSAAPRLWPANGLGALFDIGAGSHRRAVAVLVLISLVLFLPGFFQIPPVDRDEAYFAQATKQMIETGNYVDIRYQDDVRYRKPVGIYWLQAAVVKTAEIFRFPNARTTIWLYRIPSLLGAVGAVLATYWCGLAFVSRRGAILAAIMMAASTLLGGEARLAKTDAVLLFTIIAAMGVLARAYLSPREAGNARLGWTLPAIFWTALAAGILLKGPVNLMIVGLAAVTLSIYERSGRWLLALRPLAGLAWLVLIVLPWFVAIYMRVGSAFLVNSVGHDMLGKLASAQEAHGAPPGLYLVLFFATFYPGSILAGLAVAGGMDGAPRASRAFFAGLARAVVDRLRAGRHQAAALRAAALSRHRHPHCRRGRIERAVAAALARSRRGVVAHRADPHQHRRGDVRDHRRARSRVPGVAVFCHRHHLRPVRVAAL